MDTDTQMNTGIDADQGMPPSEICRFYGVYVRPHWRRLLVAGACLFGSTLMHLAQPWPLKVIFDYVLLPRKKGHALLGFLARFDRMELLAGACAAIVLVAVMYGALEYAYTVRAAGVGQRVVYVVRANLYAHIQRLSLGFHKRTKSGDLLTRLVRDVNQLRDFAGDPLLSLLSESIFVTGMVAVMLWIDWRLTLLSLLLFPLLLTSIAHFSRQIRGVTRKRLRREGRVASTFNETLAAIQVVQLFSAGGKESERFDEENLKSYRSEMRSLRLKSRLLRVVEIVTAAGTCLVLWYGARRVLNGNLSPGDLLVFVAYLKSMYKPVRRIASLSVQASKTLASAERVMQILQTEPEVRDAPGAVPAPRFRGRTEFRNVSFCYEPGRRVLEEISFRIEPGQKVALVGPSGAGKSTLVSLIPRLYDPAGGAVWIDGADIRNYTLASLRDQITVVPQEPVLFGSSVAENIAYGDPRADQKAIRLAARLAHAEEFIERLPRGYDTVLGERGASLSGGQRQRIAIARAALRSAPIVILDEPMTGLDTVSEALVLRGLENLLRDRTALIIAHRLSTVIGADLVLVIEHGRLVEAGSPKELLMANGAFRRVSELQFGPEALARQLFPPVLGPLQ